MKKLLLSALLCAVSLSGWAQLRNPVIPGYHPDPSVCRVGDDFYLVNSSFCYFPGVPVYHSRDLVNWELIGNVLDRESQLPLEGATSWLGIYAPTIRYNDGVYYMITTNVGGGGNFMVTATDPRGPWSEPLWLKQQGIDPSLYFENGRCYMVSNPDDTIMLCQIDPKTGRQLTKSVPLWQGTGGRYPEGPHIYKKDGWYYLLISEGGTELAHRLTIARSRKIEGPYEANPANPILTNCSRAGQSMQIQGTGHGDFVQAADGSWWLVLLAYRNMGGSYHHMGRETCLVPVEWKAGEWPVVNGGNPIDTLMQVKTLAPQQQRKANRQLLATQGAPEWVHLQNPNPDCYIWTKEKLRLKAAHSSLTENNHPTFVGFRQESEAFTLSAKLDFFDSFPRDEAGISVYQINDGHADFGLRHRESSWEVFVDYQLKSLHVTSKSRPINGSQLWLRVRSDGKMYYFESSTDGINYTEEDRLDCSLLSTEVVGGFTGMTLGFYSSLYYQTRGVGNTYADFSELVYREE